MKGHRDGTGVKHGRGGQIGDCGRWTSACGLRRKGLLGWLASLCTAALSNHLCSIILPSLLPGSSHLRLLKSQLPADRLHVFIDISVKNQEDLMVDLSLLGDILQADTDTSKFYCFQMLVQLWFRNPFPWKRHGVELGGTEEKHAQQS